MSVSRAKALARILQFVTIASANAALDRIESDDALAERINNAGGPERSIEILRSEGFDVIPQDLRDAVLDRFGDQLTPEMLDEVAAGADVDWSFIATVGVMSVIAYGAMAAAAV